MVAALSWIKAYVPDLKCTDQEFADAMTLTGTKVEGFKRLDKNLEKIVTGKVNKIERHPDADKLIVCQVDVGEANGGVIQIVTGAPNVRLKDVVPVVLDGGRVAGDAHSKGPAPEEGYPIKAGKLRGVDSVGMMCSLDELGVDSHYYPDAPEYGIYIFPEGTEVGLDAPEVLGLRDTVFEFEITSNRVDCYSVLGIAREVAATFRLPFHAPETACKAAGQAAGPIESHFNGVEVRDADLCPNYIAAVCANIKIGPSPRWMQQRLAASGIRPINNLVDITNYVMEEYGQPMHAFDLSTVAGQRIIVKRAADGEVFTTLDGQERKLDSDILMICDGEKEIGIAGIMGGENSMITDNVKTVLFEAAVFNGTNIRKSAKRLGLRTDASGKFEKGLEPDNARKAIERACHLVEELGCGDVAGGLSGVCIEGDGAVRQLPFKPDYYNSLLGTEVSREDMLSYFERLDIGYDEASDMLTMPPFRQDLIGQADIAEEVARFYGYDKIGVTLPSGEATTGRVPFKVRLEQTARTIIEHYGFCGAMCYSFESPRVFDRLMIPKDSPLRNTVTISNPLGEDFSIMRTVSVNGILTSLATNYNRRNKDVRLYEFGNIYLPKALPVTELPKERMQLTLGMYGDGDFFDMKGVLESYFRAIGIDCSIHGGLRYDPNAEKSYLHPGRQALIMMKDVCLGYLGEVHPKVAEAYGIGTKAYLGVLDMPAIIELASFERKYVGVARFPAVNRDLSLVVPKSVLAGDIESMINQRGGKILESCRLFDLYEGNQIGEGCKSMAYSISFRAADRTLEEADIQSAMKKILNGLESMGIKLREA